MALLAALSLYELNALVRDTLAMTLDSTFWLAAEMNEVRTSAAGHCFIEFVEKDEHSHKLIAKARANVWSNVFYGLKGRFEAATGQPFAAGLKVLVEVSVGFHEVYGLSLTVHDIDPAYTLGDLALRRQQILDQLRQDGIIDDNKLLPLPRPLSRIAVISSPHAAGYGDFMQHLTEHAAAFRWHTRLFEATMQGDSVEASVVAALQRIDQEREAWDAVVIIRGGGAVSDLHGFDTYLLAAAVAQFGLPVISGIGHERDRTVIDEVAHTHLKTPTAVADFLVEQWRREADLLQVLARRLDDAVRQRLHDQRYALQHLSQQVIRLFGHYATAHRHRLHLQGERLHRALIQRLLSEQARLRHADSRLRHALTHRLSKEHHLLSLARKSIEMASPSRILSLGFSITTANGRVVRRAEDLQPGDVLTTHLSEGSIESVVS